MRHSAQTAAFCKPRPHSETTPNTPAAAFVAPPAAANSLILLAGLYFWPRRRAALRSPTADCLNVCGQRLKGLTTGDPRPR